MPAPNDQDIIVATGLSREFQRADGQRVQALAEVSFAIQRGQFVCIVGPSGCGKSTLLQMIAGLLLPSGGDDRGQWRAGHRPGARARHGVPEGQRLSLAARDPQRRVRPQMPRRRQGGAAADRRGLPRARRAVARRLGLAARALGRHAETRRGRHGVRQRRRRAVARRAIRRGRLRHQAAAARGPADALVGGGERRAAHRRVRDPRRRRGPDPRRPHPGDERRPDRRRSRGRGAAAAHDRHACSRPTWCATSTCCSSHLGLETRSPAAAGAALRVAP